MRSWPRALVIVVGLGAVVAAAPRPARACLWDHDTLKEETLTDRDAAAVLRGEFGHHSTAFYQAKVAYTRPAVDAGTAPRERYDDLAVALAKTGATADALAVLDAKERRFPDEYTTKANRGTVLAMRGDLAGALIALRAAVAQNPDAHFGREEFQIRLLEYKLRLAQDPTVAERESFLTVIDHRLMFGHQTKHAKDRPDLDRAVVALTGLIRFGGADRDRDVWYALAWTLVQRGDNQLALLALRRAETLGHPRAGLDGGFRAAVVRSLGDLGCCPDPGSPDAVALWAKASRQLDPVLAAGARAEAKRRRAEDRLVGRKQWRRAFGY